MSDAVHPSNAMPAPTPRNGGHRVFSARLDAFLDNLQEGQAPNSGAFCAFCYNPLPAGFEGCDHCGQNQRERPPVASLPNAVIEMYRRKQRRESLIVNSFAYLGLALGLALFLGLVAINVLYLERALWFFILATVAFLVGSRLFAAIFGGVIGDEVGFRYASKRLAEDWSNHVAQREIERSGQ
ncbi:MAG: hypothetical protein GEU75_14330 [Dehalococcoidia bacterium]|nr:hypothetical protein [Dehalococcoidia bacterium]